MSNLTLTNGVVTTGRHVWHGVGQLQPNPRVLFSNWGKTGDLDVTFCPFKRPTQSTLDLSHKMLLFFAVAMASIAFLSALSAMLSSPDSGIQRPTDLSSTTAI